MKIKILFSLVCMLTLFVIYLSFARITDAEIEYNRGFSIGYDKGIISAGGIVIRNIHFEVTSLASNCGSIVGIYSDAIVIQKRGLLIEGKEE